MNLSKYKAEPIAADGVVNHNFLNASDAPGQFEAEECNRQAVTAKWLHDHPDVDGYLFLPEDAEMGLDPWRAIDGVDALVDGSKIILWIGRTGEKQVDPGFVVYAARKAVLKEVSS